MYDSDELRALAVAAQRGDDSPRLDLRQAMTPETVLALLDEIEAMRKDAERYKWLSKRFTGFDFDWMPSEEGDGKFVLCFEMDKKMSISRDVTASIDAAMTQGGDA